MFAALSGYKMNIQRVDAARYFILHKFGGVYADLDYEITVDNLWDILPPSSVGLVESPFLYNEAVQNSFMSSPPGAGFWNETWAVMEQNRNLGVLRSTGPGMLTEVIGKLGNDPDRASSYDILPCENFQRLPFGEYHGSEFINVLGREILPRLYPMKYCGDIKRTDNCHYGKHHGSANWTSEAIV